MKDINESRAEISSVDKEMAALFERRMAASVDVAEYKKAHGLPIYDEIREKELMERNSSYIEDPLVRSYYRKFLRECMTLSKDYQHHIIDGMKVAYSGVEGAFAHIAATRIFPRATTLSYPGFESAYKSVEDGECDCAVLPIENSYAGEVGSVMDLIFNGSLYINGAYDLKISQNLLGIKGSTISDIKTVISHPQALAQCEPYIKKHGLSAVNSTNTAEAARLGADMNDRTTAAIASYETAALYGLTLLDHDINESSGNTTRFAVLSRTAMESLKSDKGTFVILFTVNDEAGALVKAISVIGKYGFNMKVLRSRPVNTRQWQYYFYVEAEGDETTKDGRAMLKELAKQCDELKIAGHYSPSQTSKDLNNE